VIVDEFKGKIDLTSGGIFAASLGNYNSRIIASIMKVIETGVYCSYAPRFNNYWRDRYIEELKEFTGFTGVALFSVGTEATEAFWRLARTINGRPGIWGGLIDPDDVGKDKPRCDSMHGMTLGSLIMAGKMTWQELGYFPELGEKRFGMAPEATAGMIMEPYHAASGKFHRIEPTINRVRLMHDTYPEIFLCLDEIQGGFGRTGKLWAHQHYGDLLKPEFVTIGKACGGGLPLSAILGPAEFMAGPDAEKAHLHSTHSGNPVMCAVGSAVIRAYRDFNLIEESARKGKIMHEMLAKFPVPTAGAGLMAGLEFLGPEEADAVVRKCEERGVLVVDTGRKWVKVGPALTIGDDELIKGIGILGEVVDDIVAARRDSSEGHGAGDTVVSSAGVPGAGDKDGDLERAAD